MGIVAIVGTLLLMCAIAHTSVAFTEGLLPNGNFEQGPARSELNGTQLTSRTAIPSWEISGYVEYIESGHKQGDMLLVVPEGSYAVRLGNEASIKQRVKVAGGLRYSLTFSAARTCAQAEQLNVSASGQSGVLAMQTVYSSNGWDSYAWAWIAKSDDVDVIIHNPGVTDDPACGPLIDSVAMKALYPPKPTNKNLLKNGDFEEGPYILPNTSWGVLIPSNTVDDHCPIPGWMVESLKAVKYLDSAHFSVPKDAAPSSSLRARKAPSPRSSAPSPAAPMFSPSRSVMPKMPAWAPSWSRPMPPVTASRSPTTPRAPVGSSAPPSASAPRLRAPGSSSGAPTITPAATISAPSAGPSLTTSPSSACAVRSACRKPEREKEEEEEDYFCNCTIMVVPFNQQ
uniref:DUF642 domain-containing protein n=1 Tax=Ananas comosus var. bracteatus TaxID=296719 RepID=A0A6V7QJM0_ANACO|nr:unnamed protein product [Ananas comosus var. bracteatus]